MLEAGSKMDKKETLKYLCIFLLASFAVLNMLDFYRTFHALTTYNNAFELNPLSNIMISYGWSVYFIFKAIVSIVCISFIFILNRFGTQKHWKMAVYIYTPIFLVFLVNAFVQCR